MSEDAKKLLPCPFCGTTRIVEVPLGQGYTVAKCFECNIHRPVEKWNIRAAPSRTFFSDDICDYCKKEINCRRCVNHDQFTGRKLHPWIGE